MHESSDRIQELEGVTDSLVAKTFTGMYAMHKYWAKKPYNVVNAFIGHFTNNPNHIVLDPFVGSGIVPCEALKLDRRAVAIDLNPMAIFITRMTAIPIDLTSLTQAYSWLEKHVRNAIDSLYVTGCSHCLQESVISHTIYKDSSPTDIKFHCSQCRKDYWKSPNPSDIVNTNQLEDKDVPYWYPTTKLIRNSRINVAREMHVVDLFSKRNLIALSILFNGIQAISDDLVRDVMRFVFTSAIPQASKMVFVIRNRRKGKKKGPEVGSWVAGYWVPSEHFEINVWRCFANRYKRVVRGKKESNNTITNYHEADSFADLMNGATVYYSNQSATMLGNIPNNSIDYIFTDPPHGDRVPYFELSLMWNSWLGFEADLQNEIVISNSPTRNKGFDDYKLQMDKAFKELYRVLKPDRFMSVAFNTRSAEVLHSLLAPCWCAGFEIVNVTKVTTSAGSVMQDSRAGALRGDYVITFQKRDMNNSANQTTSEATRKLTLEAAKEAVSDSKPKDIDCLVREVSFRLLERSVHPSQLEIKRILTDALQTDSDRVSG